MDMMLVKPSTNTLRQIAQALNNVPSAMLSTVLSQEDSFGHRDVVADRKFNWHSCQPVLLRLFISWVKQESIA